MPTLDFKGKQFVYSHHHTVPFRELAVDAAKSQSATPNLEDNLIIHGDNLHGLKALLPLYAGKIKCIYIDPPYNTGNEGWCYNDNVNSPLIREWLKKTANPVDKEDMERHDKWLCMMFPRLKLLHELLADDGVIFVSIDDNEVHHLRAVMDEIWGEENFVENIIITRSANGMGSKEGYATNHDYVLTYKRNSLSENIFLGVKPTNYFIDKFDKCDEYGKYKIDGIFRKKGQGAKREESPNCFYPIYYSKNTGEVYLDYEDGLEEAIPKLPNGHDGRWIWSKDFAKDKLYRLYASAKGTIYVKDYWRNDIRQKPKSVFADSGYLTDRSTNEIINIFGEKAFSTPKPVKLIQDLLDNCADKNAIILDSFAGSGTTAHAVLALNKEDGGNRKFILVEMEEYAHTITAERVRRVIKGVPTAKDTALQQGLGGSFTFCTLGDAFDIEKMLKGEALPTWDALARYVFYTATGKSLKEGTLKANADYFVGETELYEVYLIYKPDLAFLRSPDCALNSTKVEQIAARGSKKQKLVFAADKFMSQKDLTDKNITFCQLPYAIHKVGV